MNLKDRVEKLFEKYAAIATQLSEEKQEVKMAEATLDSGQVISTEAEQWAVGVPVFVINEEGEQIPLPDGEYKLEDGTVFTVAEGMVAEWTAPAEAPAAEEELSEEVLTKELVSQMIEAAVAKVTENFSKQLKEKEAKLEQLSKQPAGGLVRNAKAPQVSREELAKMPLDARVRAIANRFS
jgi:hypothetical protein